MSTITVHDCHVTESGLITLHDDIETMALTFDPARILGWKSTDHNLQVEIMLDGFANIYANCHDRRIFDRVNSILAEEVGGVQWVDATSLSNDLSHGDDPGNVGDPTLIPNKD